MPHVLEKLERQDLSAPHDCRILLLPDLICACGSGESKLLGETRRREKRDTIADDLSLAEERKWGKVHLHSTTEFCAFVALEIN